MNNRLLLIGGILNSFFVIFHVFLGWQIQILSDLLPEYKALMQMLNVGGVMIIAYAALASFAFKTDLVNTGLGKTTMLLIALFYAVRAAEEIILAPQFSVMIFVVCLIVAAVYVPVIITAFRNKPQPMA